MKSPVKIGLAATASVTLALGLTACGGSSEPTPSPTPETSAPATQDPSNPNSDALEVPAPDTNGKAEGLVLSVSGTQQTAIGDGQITVSGGTISVGIGGASSLVGDKILLTYQGTGGTRVLNKGEQVMKPAEGASYALFNINNIEHTQTYQLMTIKPSNMPNLNSSNLLPGDTPVSGYSKQFTVNYQQN